MPDVLMRRTALNGLFDSAPQPHAGLWLARGLPQWKEKADEKGKDFQKHIDKAAKLKVPDIYREAYTRWEKYLLEANAEVLCGKLDGRLFIGLGGASVLETAITLSRTYGVPVIPGSAVKGLTRAYAETQTVLSEDPFFTLFGKIGDTPEDSDAGYVLFHDAWWIPEDKPPLAAEIVTVHHQEYYNSGGDVTNASDFDSPVPNQQIAARGSFLFAVECGDKEWAKYAMNLLSMALQHWGIGGKTAAGYGRFVPDEHAQEFLERARVKLQKQQQIDALAKLPLEEQMCQAMKTLSVMDFPRLLSKDKNKTFTEWEAKGYDKNTCLALLREFHGDTIQAWANGGKHEKKVYTLIFSSVPNE